MAVAPQTPQVQLALFDVRHASTVARWVTTPDQLRLLAPSTEPPLTATNVNAWVKPGGTAFLLHLVHGHTSFRRLDRCDPNRAREQAAWTETHKKTGEGTLEHEADPIGYGELNPMSRTPRHFWIGHVIVAPPHRGSGIGTAFVRLLTDHAFQRLRAEKVSLVVFPDNAPAIRCYLRAGFTNLGEEHHRFNGTGPKHRLLRFEIVPPKLPE